MKIINVFNNHEKIRITKKKIIDLLNFTFKGEHKNNYNVNVIFVCDLELLDINKIYLNHNYLTDVITFNLNQSDSNKSKINNSDLIEGEIYISVDRAKEQSKIFNVKFYNEVYRLAIHGALHLCGYEDNTDVKRLSMTNLENHYLTNL
ncbi:MAG: rRNA maturation RNase YbeY [Chlorobiota bacterium]|nr:MAG: rRNA maturation RNase YbeY [Chlorobiota bacterium]